MKRITSTLLLAVTALGALGARLRHGRDHPLALLIELDQPLLEPLEATRTTDSGARSIASSGPASASTGTDVVDSCAPGSDRGLSLQRWHQRHRRASQSPRGTVASQRMFNRPVVWSGLPSVRTATHVLRRIDNPSVMLGHPHHLAASIPSVKLVGLKAVDGLYWASEVGGLPDEVEQLLTDATRPMLDDRTLATVLFTDIVDSTGELERRGDSDWREILDRYDRTVGNQIGRFGGQVVGATGDGSVAIFDVPSRAVRSACAIRDAVRSLDLSVRVGIHTGEIEHRDHEIAGIAVHIAARLVAIAAPGEIVASSTVHDLTTGGPVHFNDHGIHVIKGLSTPWQLFTVNT